ncbi:MAG TPA: 2-oxoglutarate dehydrogenase E1 component [Longimicrobiales bacterium]
MTDFSRSFDPSNAAYVQSMYEEFIRNPASVDEAWRAYFSETTPPADGAAPPARAGATSIPQLRAARAFGELIDAIRLHGHRAARLDPLGSKRSGHPMLEPGFHGATLDEIEAVPVEFMGLSSRGRTTAEVVEWFRQTYMGTIGYEYEHLEHPERREWLREQIETGTHRKPMSAEDKKELLKRLAEVEALEQFIHRAYLGQKRFSIEGTDMVVPMLDLAIERASARGAREVVIGMAHRGRLNVLAHVLRVPYEKIIAKFEGRHAETAGTGDVKYHLGADTTYATASGQPLSVQLAPNPSHLEFIDAVVVGMARARQTQRNGRELKRDENVVLPIQIHGDSAFAGQGVVAEILNLAQLQANRVGGSLHIIENNQIGFTTGPREARSTHYASDMAKGFDIPIFHVNADDPEACLAVSRLALAYRDKFHGDVVIDLVGYRRFGHNEGDEPAYTQPVMYHQINEHPSVRKLWAEQLVTDAVITAEEAESIWQAAYQQLVVVQAQVKSEQHIEEHATVVVEKASLPEVKTGVQPDRLLELDKDIHTWPADFTVQPKLARQLQRRARLLGQNQGIEWAHAETLAFASLLTEGVPIRLTGQDTERGTFSQRHLVLHDVNTDTKYCPLTHLENATAPFEVYNSALSELAVMGFEYGYSVVAPEALVLWEGQFGDFGNGAQVIIDQFIAAGRAKWGQTSRLVLLLPHGYEGQGPEHSSARLERFLQLCAEDNMRVANCTTPAQYFHLLRRQALLETRRPLIVMTPKSLLRHPKATSRLSDFANAGFQLVIGDPAAQQNAASVRRAILCSGKVFYDLSARLEHEPNESVGVIRIEQLYPFPEQELQNALDPYKKLEEVVWLQEEPENMGAWRYMRPRLQALLGDRATLAYSGRPERASPAEGYASDHEAEQARIVSDAIGGSAARKKARK